MSLGSLPHRAEVPASLQLLPWCPCAASHCRSSHPRAWLFRVRGGICSRTWWGVQPLGQLTLLHTTSYDSLEWPRHFSVGQEPAKTAAGSRPALGGDTTAASLPARGGEARVPRAACHKVHDTGAGVSASCTVCLVGPGTISFVL